MGILSDPDMSGKNARERYEEIRAALDQKLFVEAMDLDCRLSELERRAGDRREYTLSLTDHASNLRIIERRLEQLETRLGREAKPN